MTNDPLEVGVFVVLPSAAPLTRSVGLEVVNNDARSSDAIARALDGPQVIVEHILALFESRGWIDTRQETTPWMDIYNVSPELERWLEDT